MDKISNNHFFNFLKQPFNVHNKRAEVAQSPLDINKPENSNVSFNGNGVIAAKVVFQSISRQFNTEQTVTKTSEQDVGSAKNSLFDVESVVNTIFDFVSNGIEKAKANGADDEQLNAMFEQAREGVNRGLDEALAELEDISLLTEDIENGVAQTRNIFEEQLGNLKQSYFPEDAIPETQAQQYMGATKAYSESSILELTTKEGDKVSISFNQNQSAGFSYDQSNSDNGFSQSLSLSSFSSKSFSYTVEGDLSDDEKAAIGNLVSQIADVQESFFGNNIEEAYQRVSALNVDFNQISSVSLELTQTQTVATQSYKAIENMDSNIGNLASIKDDIDKVSNFMEQIKALKDDADESLNINNGQLVSLMNAMFKEVFEPSQSSADVFNLFAQQLLQNDDTSQSVKIEEGDIDSENEKTAQ